MTARRVTRALGDLFAAQARTRAALTAPATPAALAPTTGGRRQDAAAFGGVSCIVLGSGEIARLLSPQPTPPAPTPEPVITRHPRPVELATALDVVAAILAPEPGTTPPAEPAKAAPTPYDDDPDSDFYIPPYLRREATSTARDTRPEAPRTYTMPTTAAPERNHPRGVNAKLRALGWRPADIRKLSAREADEAAAIGREPPRPVGRAAS